MCDEKECLLPKEGNSSSPLGSVENVNEANATLVVNVNFYPDANGVCSPSTPLINASDDATIEKVGGDLSSNSDVEAEMSEPMIIRNNELGAPDIIPVDECSTNGHEKYENVIPDSYSGHAWLSILFCCIPVAIMAIWKSDQVVKAVRRNDLESARHLSRQTKRLSSLAIIYGIILIMLGIGLYFLISNSLLERL